MIDKALAGDAVAARFVVVLTSPKPRGREIHLEMPADDDCNVVSAFNAALRALCNGEITPDEALQVSRFLDGRRRVLQAWQLEEKLTSYCRTIPGDPEWAPDEADEDEEEGDDDSDDFDEDADAAGALAAMTDPDHGAAAPAAGPAVADLQTACISRPPPAPEPRRGTGALPTGDRLAVLAALLAAADGAALTGKPLAVRQIAPLATGFSCPRGIDGASASGVSPVRCEPARRRGVRVVAP